MSVVSLTHGTLVAWVWLLIHSQIHSKKRTRKSSTVESTYWSLHIPGIVLLAPTTISDTCSVHPIYMRMRIDTLVHGIVQGIIRMCTPS